MNTLYVRLFRSGFAFFLIAVTTLLLQVWFVGPTITVILYSLTHWACALAGVYALLALGNFIASRRSSQWVPNLRVFQLLLAWMITLGVFGGFFFLLALLHELEWIYLSYACIGVAMLLLLCVGVLSGLQPPLPLDLIFYLIRYFIQRAPKQLPPAEKIRVKSPPELE